MRMNQGWFRPIAILALCRLVPVFGEIAVNGFFYDWARESAWKVDRPMKNNLGDMGKTLKLGLMVWGIMIIWSMAVSLALSILEIIPVLGVVAAVVAIPASILVYMLASVAGMRAAIYDSFEPVLQIKQAWNMLFHDFGGAVRAFCIQLINVGIGFLVTLVIFGIASLLGIGAGLLGYFDYTYIDPSMVDPNALLGLLALLPLIILVGLVFSYVLNLFALTVTGLQIKALGYWTADFDVARWGGQQDPMPFEREKAAANAAAAAAAAAAARAQAVEAARIQAAEAAARAQAMSQPAAQPVSVEPAAEPQAEPAVPQPAVEDIAQVSPGDVADLGGVQPGEAAEENGILAEDGSEE